MRSELNDYKITNADGIIKSSNDGKIKYSNENPHYIEENSLSVQDENFNENETFDLDKKVETKNQKTSNDANSSLNSTSATSTTASTASSTASTISSSLGSVIGGVVSSVATAVIVAVAFVSMLTINIALVMAGTNSLVFQLEMIGAQQEDFENKTYYAVLEGDGYSQSQEIFQDSVYITFEDLEPGKEYTITIKNDEKIFVEKSYFTATEDIQRGFVEVSNEENTIYAFVSCRKSKSNEFYTFTATDSSGKILFRNSDVKQEKEYSFDIEKPDTITFTLSIDGKVCCFEQLTIFPEPEYDFENGIWNWNQDYSMASITFSDIYGGEPLTYEAFVQEYETPATCEEAGNIVYTASIYVEQADAIFSDEQIVELEPIGHDYGEPMFEWTQNGNDMPSATATFTCLNDSSHQMVLTAEVSIDSSSAQVLQYVATVIFDGVEYTDIFQGEGEEESEDLEISLNEGQIYISANGYARRESGLSNPTEFVSSADNPYLIQNQEIYGCDNIINVYQTNQNIGTADIYIKLKDITIEAGAWCSLFRIVAMNTLNIHLIIEGNVSFVGGNGQQVFSSQGGNSPTVTIIIDQTSAGGTFNVETPDGLTYAQSGTINVRYV